MKKTRERAKAKNKQGENGRKCNEMVIYSGKLKSGNIMR